MFRFALILAAIIFAACIVFEWGSFDLNPTQQIAASLALFYSAHVVPDVSYSQVRTRVIADDDR